MTTTLKAFFILVTSILLFASCKEDCTPTINEPTEDELDWLVYKQGDTVKFVNQDTVPVNFIRTNIRINTVAGDNVAAGAECIDQQNTEILNVIEDLAGTFPGLATYILSKPNDLRVMVVGQPNFAYEIDEGASNLAALEVNDTNYMDVHEIIPPANTAANSIKRILFNKEFGFLSVEYNDGRKLERRF